MRVAYPNNLSTRIVRIGGTSLQTGDRAIRGGAHMDSLWRAMLWAQLGAAIDMLDQALVACPDSLWRERLWRDPSDHPVPPEFAEFWYLAYHALFWLDLYCSGSVEGFAPPAPYTLGALDPGAAPERPYSRDELRTYLAAARRQCHAALETRPRERARQSEYFPEAQ